MKDYYYILGLEKDATLEQIKIAHRILSKKFHPDLNPNEPHSEKMFKDIQEAYECLSNSQKRKEYDRQFHTENRQMNEDVIVPKDKRSVINALLIILTLGFVGGLIITMTNGFEDKSPMFFGLAGAALASAFLAPFLVAIYLRHPLKWAVLAALVILGWTGLGWVGCLIFSFFGKANN